MNTRPSPTARPTPATLAATAELAAAITRSASKQTYYTIRLLVDRPLVADAYRAYAYFRWVDDTLDAETGSRGERLAFVHRQAQLLESCYLGAPLEVVHREEQMLLELVENDREKDSGLQVYLRSMMKIMLFDAGRRGRLVTQSELDNYTLWLASAVTEALHHFVGHNCPAPHDETRYLAVIAAHTTHMLRDTYDDLSAGYYNIPREILEANRIGPGDVTHPAYQAWVRSQVELARLNFRIGREYLARVENPRCRLAGYAYMARFEWLLDTIEGENFLLRPQYNERKSLANGLRMGGQTLASLFHAAWRLPADRFRTGVARK